MSFIQNLEWRYATKKFDTSKKVSSEDLQKILDAIRLTPTSFGIQPYKAVVVSNQEIKDKLQVASWNQPQVGTASEVIVFVARTDLHGVSDEFFTELSGGNAEIRESLSGYENMVKGSIDGNYGKEPLKYASEQAHIALGFAMAALTELKIDSCALGGFDPVEYAKILGLPENELPCVVLPIGYRDASENPRPKFRKSADKIFSFVK